MTSDNDPAQQPGPPPYAGPPQDGPPPPPPYGAPPPSYNSQPPPPHGAPPPGPPAHGGYGYAPQPMRREEERLWAIAAHLGPLVVGVIAPLVVWLLCKDRSAFLDRSAKEALNMQISYLIYGVVAGFSILLLVGIVLLPVIGVAWFVLLIVGTVKAAAFEDYRYPLILRLVS